MASPDPDNNTEKKIKSLEQELNDLRQGLTLVADYSQGLQRISRRKVAAEAMDQTIVKPLLNEEIEFEGIWRFHEEALVADPEARVPFATMYDEFAGYCRKTGRNVVDQDAFEFVFAHIENPAPVPDGGEWIGYRLRSVSD